MFDDLFGRECLTFFLEKPTAQFAELKETADDRANIDVTIIYNIY